MLKKLLVATLLLAGCNSGIGQDPPAGRTTPENVIERSELDGSWTFQSDLPDRLPTCLDFDHGTLLYYSGYCDGINDLIVVKNAEITGSDFTLSFSIRLAPTGQATIKYEGTVLDENRIRISSASGNMPGGTFGLTTTGMLIRN